MADTYSDTGASHPSPSPVQTTVKVQRVFVHNNWGTTQVYPAGSAEEIKAVLNMLKSELTSDSRIREVNEASLQPSYMTQVEKIIALVKGNYEYIEYGTGFYNISQVKPG